MSLIHTLKTEADLIGLDLSEEMLTSFRKYFDYLVEKNKVMNLTAITEEDEAARLHFIDSISPMIICDFSGKSVIDVGTGAGFPGLPLKIACPGISLTLLDAQQKRVNFLSETCELIGVEADCIHARAEEAAINMRESFDYAVSRAVARLNVLAELCIPFVKVGGAFIALKSISTEEEIDEAKSAIKTLGAKIEKVEDYPISGADVIHRAIVIRKLSATPKQYPRRFAKMQKSPL